MAMAGIAGASGHGADGSEFEGTPGVIEAIGVSEVNVAARSSELGVPRLHPHDLLCDASLCGDGEAAHAAADARERGAMEANVLERADHHCGDKGSGRDGVVCDRVGPDIGELELRGERRADWAACSGAALFGASWFGAGADQIHE